MLQAKPETTVEPYNREDGERAITNLKMAHQDSCGACAHATFMASFFGDTANAPDGNKVVRRVWFAVLGKCRLGVAVTPNSTWNQDREAYIPFGLLPPPLCEGQGQEASDED